MTNTEQLQPLIELLRQNKKISNQEIMNLMNTDYWGLQTIRNILIDGENILNDNFTGIRLRNPDKVGFIDKLFGKKAPLIPINPRFDIFISYSRKNLVFVNTLIQKIILHQKKYALQPLRFFFDKTEIKNGDDWKAKLLQGLKHSTAMLVNVSPDYFGSFYCEWEWQNFISFEIEKKLVRQSINWVYMDKSDDFDQEDNHNEWHKELKARQYLDLRPFRKPNSHEIKDIYEAILNTIHKAELVKQPIQNNIPSLNFRTLARNTHLAIIEHKLWFTPLKQYPAIVLTGENGVGKTTLAYSYAKANTHKYEGGIFVLENANLMADLLDFRPYMLQTLGVEMTIADREDPQWMKQTLNGELRKRGQMLWIVDNIQDCEWLKSPERLQNLFPAEAKIHWIFTTNTLTALVNRMNFMVERIDDFSQDEAMSYLSTYQPIITETQKQNCRELLQLIGLKPINVMILGSLLYLQQVNDSTEEVEQHLEQAPSVQIALNNAIAQLPPTEQRILQLASLMPHDALVIEWLFEFDTWLNESKRGVSKPTFENWQLATNHLLGLGFLTNTDIENIKNINPALLKYTDKKIAFQLSDIYHEFLTRKVETNKDYKNLSFFAQYFIKTIPHSSLLKIDVLYDLVKKLKIYSLPNKAIDICNLLIQNHQKFSSSYLGHIHYAKANVLVDNAQESLALIHAEMSIEQSIKLKNDNLLSSGYQIKSSIFRKLGKYTESLFFIGLSIKILEKNNLEKNNDSLAICYSEKSKTLEALEKYEEALVFINSSIEIHEKNIPLKNAMSLANVYKEKSSILKNLGKYIEALVFINRSIEIYEKNNPEKNTNLLANSYSEKSIILESLGFATEAVEFINRSIEILEKNSPDKNSDSLAEGYYRMSRILLNLYEDKKALKFINRSIEIYENNHFWKKTDSLAWGYYQKSRILMRLGNNQQALVFINISIEIREINFPEKLISLSWAYDVKSKILYNLDKIENALEFINKAIYILRVNFPNSNDMKDFEDARKAILEKLK